MSQRIEVGVLGRHRAWWASSSSRSSRAHPWFKLTWVGASERSAGQKYRDAASWKLPVPPPADLADLVVQEARPGNGAPELVFSAMDAVGRRRDRGGLRQGRPRRRQQLAQPSDGRRRAAAGARDQQRPHRRCSRRQRAARGWSGAHRHQPELLDGDSVDGPGAAAPVRPEVGRRHDAAGAVGRRLSRRRLARRGRQRRAVHLRRGSEDRKRAEEDPRRRSNAARSCRTRSCVSASTTRVAVVNGHTESIAVQLEQQPSLDDVRQALVSFSGAPQRHELPSAPSAADRLPAPRRTGRSRGSTSIATAA